MPMPGLTKPDTLRIVPTLPDAVIERPFMGGEINVRIEVTMSITYGSGFTA